MDSPTIDHLPFPSKHLASPMAPRSLALTAYDAVYRREARPYAYLSVGSVQALAPIVIKEHVWISVVPPSYTDSLHQGREAIQSYYCAEHYTR